MIALLTTAWAWIKGLPEIVWPILAFAAIFGGVILWDRIDDAQVVKEIEDKRALNSAKAGQQSAEDRSDAALRNIMSEQARETAIAKAEASEAAKPLEARSTLSAQDRALNCERLRQAGLTSGPNYRELCR